MTRNHNKSNFLPVGTKLASIVIDEVLFYPVTYMQSLPFTHGKDRMRKRWRGRERQTERPRYIDTEKQSHTETESKRQNRASLTFI